MDYKKHKIDEMYTCTFCRKTCPATRLKNGETIPLIGWVAVGSLTICDDCCEAIGELSKKRKKRRERWW